MHVTEAPVSYNHDPSLSQTLRRINGLADADPVRLPDLSSELIQISFTDSLFITLTILRRCLLLGAVAPFNKNPGPTGPRGRWPTD